MIRAIFQDSDDPYRPRWLHCRDPVDLVVARTAAQTPQVVSRVEQAVGEGLTAAGFLCYEAAGGLNTSLVTHRPERLPPAWFALFRGVEESEELGESREYRMGAWEPAVSKKAYDRAIARVKEYIAAGDTYQVNYTMRLRAAFEGDPLGLFERLWRAQRAAHCAFLETDDFAVCSASPELFFTLQDETLVCRPMKGTASRGCTLAEDDEAAAALAASPKDRAENAMIVDMMRNDVGRVARAGSVRVASVFEVERYPTVLQMTSTVKARTDAGIADVMQATFPCASITGAPKIRTMQIIRELEPEPRGIYTGCVGLIRPKQGARFNVAIRSVHIDKTAGRAEYGVGGGIVWDSVDRAEYAECLTKAAVLTAERPEFRLLESILWNGRDGYFLLHRHLSRLGASARYFGMTIDENAVRAELQAVGRALGNRRHKVRLLVSGNGAIDVEFRPLGPLVEGRTYRLALAGEPVDVDDPFLYHKTTHRDVYLRARRFRGDADDVLLFNARGELTETSIGNVVFELGGHLVSPPIACGLLGGVFREHLLSRGEIAEGIVRRDDLPHCDRLWMINSVREWTPAEIVTAR